MIIENMTMEEFEEGIKRTKSVIIPVGSVEEHGCHLPLATDIIQSYEIAKMVSKKIEIFVAPPIYYGLCRSTSRHPGTITISGNTLRLLIYDIVKSLYSHGLRNFIIFSGHAGGTHISSLQEIGEILLEDIKDINIAIVSDYDITVEKSKGVIESEGDSHAGEIETSRILFLKPSLIKGMGTKEFPKFPKPILVRDKRKYWLNGIWGDPTKATKEKGEILTNIAIDGLIEIIKKLENFSE
jgi:creatinine amidohydrolase